MNVHPDRLLPARCFVLLAAALLAGCQTFRPATADELQRGDRIRIELREASSVELREVTARDVTSVNGETVEVTGGELIMSAFSVRRPDGGVVPAEGWTVRFPVEEIASIRRQQLAVWRTAGLVAGIAAATVIGWESTGGGDEGGQDGGGGQVE